jgi:2-C-methyl-D-erythritol 2,4-cyclodiphosphate synthase
MVVSGSYENIKLTTPEDIATAEGILRRRGEKKGADCMRIGTGFDSHRLTEGRELIIGGVNIPYEKGLLGHSDADVLLHAISDALLGAAALGDIGGMFPDNDPAFKDADSLVLLRRVVEEINFKGYKVGNVDATVIAQNPKMKPHIEAMRLNVADACKVSVDCINIKATTEEWLGFTGAGEGIAAHCVCLIKEV